MTAAELVDLPPAQRIEYVDLPMDRLRKSPGNKRPDNVRLAQKIGNQFDDFAFGAIACSARQGWYWVVDGWTRKSGAEIAGRGHVRALVIHGYSEADDARAFVVLNRDRTATSAGQQFWAGADYGDPIVKTALAICRDEGITVLPVTPSGAASGTSAKRADTTRAYGALERIVQIHGPGALRDAFRVIRRVWKDDPRALESAPIYWIANFIALYGSHANWSAAHFVEKLEPISLITIVQRINAFQSIAGTKGGSSANRYGPPAPRNVLLDIYNRGLRKRTLPEATQSVFKRLALGQSPWSDQ